MMKGNRVVGDKEQFHRCVNIVLVGNRYVGKTSLVFQVKYGTFSFPYCPTTGTDFIETLIKTHDDEYVRVKLWDTSGDVRTRESIAKRLYPLAAGFIIMYDVTDIQSYNDIYYWMRIIDRYATEYAKIVIMGNKIDIRPQIVIPEEDYVTKEDGLEAAFCYQGKAMEVSVSEMKNVEKSLRRMVTSICDKTQFMKDRKRTKKIVKEVKFEQDVEEWRPEKKPEHKRLKIKHPLEHRLKENTAPTKTEEEKNVREEKLVERIPVKKERLLEESYDESASIDKTTSTEEEVGNDNRDHWNVLNRKREKQQEKQWSLLNG